MNQRYVKAILVPAGQSVPSDLRPGQYVRFEASGLARLVGYLNKRAVVTTKNGRGRPRKGSPRVETPFNRPDMRLKIVG